MNSLLILFLVAVLMVQGYGFIPTLRPTILQPRLLALHALFGGGASNPPKRPATAFFRYSKDVRPQVVKENPNVRITEIAKIIGAKWRALPPAEKEKYFKQAKEELDRYKQMTKK